MVLRAGRGKKRGLSDREEEVEKLIDLESAHDAASGRREDWKDVGLEGCVKRTSKL